MKYKILKDKEKALQFLNKAVEDFNPQVFLMALRVVIKSQSQIKLVAHHLGVNESTVRTMLSKRGNPSMFYIFKIMDFLGYKLDIVFKKKPEIPTFWKFDEKSIEDSDSDE